MVVCVNRFATDTQEELDLVVEKVKEYGATGVIANHWADGGKGAVDVAQALIEATTQKSNFK